MMKTMRLLLLLVASIVIVNAQYPEEEELKCNFRVCGIELLNFKHFGISSIFKKVEMASFCIKNCTPPVVHEFYHSIIFAITRRIPHQCSGADCADKNRFVALAKCAQERSWPLLKCSKNLIDLAQIGLLDITHMEKRNTTCRIVVETTQCIEENLQICGEMAFSLVKEIFTDVIQMGINAYCHPAYRDSTYIPITTNMDFQERMKYFTDIPPRPGKHPYPQFVKGYQHSSATKNSQSLLCNIPIFVTIIASLFMLRH